MKKMMNMLMVGMLGICFGLSAAKRAAVYREIEVTNWSEIPAVVTFAGQDVSCKVQGVLKAKQSETFRVPCTALASLTIKFDMGGGSFEKQFTDAKTLKSSEITVYNSKSMWATNALNGITLKSR